MVFSKLFKKKPRLQEIEQKRNIARHGQALKKLKEMPEWADLIQVKERFQEDAGCQAVNALSDDNSRRFAAFQYSTLHTFFLEISRRIQAGDEAQKELEKLVSKK